LGAVSDVDFAEVYESAFTRLTAALQSLVGDRAEAEDLVQEAFCRALARWPEVSQLNDPAGWVSRVARNLAISRWRLSRRLTRYDRLSLPAAVHDGAGHDLTRALAQLPDRQRRALLLHHSAGFSVREVAASAGVPEGTVRSWLSRGRTALQRSLA
jgi:RNA polymerase sigma-70 factor, ECF subfamily